MKLSSFSNTNPSSPLHSPHHPSYSSTQPPNYHPFYKTILDENIDHAESIINKWDIDYGEKFSPLFVEDRPEAKRLIEVAISLQSAMHYNMKLSAGSDKLIRAHKLMQIAMKRLEKEFYTILSANRKNLDSESVSRQSSRASTRSSISDSDIEEEAERASDVAMADLQSIADCMMTCGYGKECVNVYKIVRKSIIDENLYYLGVERLNLPQMKKMDWTILEPKIRRWINAVKVAVKALFYGERILCNIVFGASEKIAQSCFTEISRDAALNLFTLPENLSKCKKTLSPEKIFRVLDLYEAISDLWPEIESVFSGNSFAAVRSQAVVALLKLGEAVRIMLGQFEAAIQKDSSKSPAGGGVHPLSRYVMNFLVFLTDYSGAVSDIVQDWPVEAHAPPEYNFSSPNSSYEGESSAAAITARLGWLILVLLCKLDGKAALYDDVALSYLFLANNLNYVASKVRNSNLGLLMGPDWIWKHDSKVKQYLANYERIGWTKVISSLPENPTAEIPPHEVRACFENFYVCFEEAYKKQRSWIIPDPKLRDVVKISVARKIIPGYRVVYQKHRGKFTIIRYAPDDLANHISDLFLAGFETGNTSSHEISSTSYLSSRGR